MPCWKAASILITHSALSAAYQRWLSISRKGLPTKRLTKNVGVKHRSVQPPEHQLLGV